MSDFIRTKSPASFCLAASYYDGVLEEEVENPPDSPAAEDTGAD